MSRRTIPAHVPGMTVVVGWDNPLGTFFARSAATTSSRTRPIRSSPDRRAVRRGPACRGPGGAVGAACYAHPGDGRAAARLPRRCALIRRTKHPAAGDAPPHREVSRDKAGPMPTAGRAALIRLGSAWSCSELIVYLQDEGWRRYGHRGRPSAAIRGSSPLSSTVYAPVLGVLATPASGRRPRLQKIGHGHRRRRSPRDGCERQVAVRAADPARRRRAGVRQRVHRLCRHCVRHLLPSTARDTAPATNAFGSLGLTAFEIILVTSLPRSPSGWWSLEFWPRA